MNEYVNQAMILFQKMIAAATPVAQKAWEISLLTLQIDALQIVVQALGLLVLGVIGVYMALRPLRRWAAKLDETDASNPFPYMLVILVGCISFFCLFRSLYLLFDVWLWVKLFKPELWLAHGAIEAVVSKLVK